MTYTLQIKNEPSPPTSTDTDLTSTAKCHLLDLPAELRNRIYEYVLVGRLRGKDAKKKRRRVTHQQFKQPGLLRTCRQIRSEASPIYYGARRFIFDMDNYDTDMLNAFCEQYEGSLPSETATQSWPETAFHVRTDANDWGRVLEWLERYWANEVPRFVCAVSCGGHACCAASAAFDIVDALDELDWERIVPVLEIHKKATERRKRLKWRWA